MNAGAYEFSMKIGKQERYCSGSGPADACIGIPTIEASCPGLYLPDQFASRRYGRVNHSPQFYL